MDVQEAIKKYTKRRGRPPGPRQFSRKYQVKELANKHKEVIRLAALGCNGKEIAAATGYSETTVSVILNSRIVNDKLQQLHEGRDMTVMQARDLIEKAQPRAQQLLTKVLDGDEALNPTLKDRIRTAQYILEQGGNGPIKKQQTDIRQAILTTEDIISMRDSEDEIDKVYAEYEEEDNERNGDG